MMYTTKLALLHLTSSSFQTRSDMQRVEAVAVAPHPMAFAAATHHPAPYYGPPMAGAVVATDMAMHHAAREAAVAGAVVGAEVAAANRQAEIAYEASRNPYYYGAAPPGAYVQVSYIYTYLNCHASQRNNIRTIVCIRK